MQLNWPWNRGPKRGIARGVAVFGSAEDADGLASQLGQRDELERWLAERGDTLTDTPADLVLVDGAIDDWKEQPDIGPKLGNTVGLFLGSVLVRQVEGARWHAWPNGHPVVRLKSGHEYDVVALAGQRVQLGTPPLASILTDAMDHLE